MSQPDEEPEQGEVAERLERAKRASAAQLLFKAARLLNEHTLARLRHEIGAPGLRASHTALFPHIGLEGTRPTALAERLGVSKQAVGQLVAELEQMGVLERVPDPTDGRARLVRFVRGGEGLLEGVELLRRVERELDPALGPGRWARMRQDLSALIEVIEAIEPGEKPPENQ